MAGPRSAVPLQSRSQSQAKETLKPWPGMAWDTPGWPGTHLGQYGTRVHLHSVGYLLTCAGRYSQRAPGDAWQLEDSHWWRSRAT